MTSYKVTIRCLTCQHRYERVMKAESADLLADRPDPPCPKCRKRAKTNVPTFDYTTGQAPAVGGSLIAKAVDTTTEMVMQDYGMTDLRDAKREGDTMAPKLPGPMQSAADNFFNRPKQGQRLNPNAGSSPLMGMSPGMVRNAAVSGRFMTPDTPNPVAMHHKRQSKLPVNIVAGDGVKRAG